jgi:hypothetical protein
MVMSFILWGFAVMLVMSGLTLLVRGQVLWGIGIVVTGFLVGPIGVSLFT